MKSIKYIIFLSLLSVIACDRSLEFSTPDWDVSVEKNTYSVGDTVTFTFSGSADYVTFYAGDEGHNYIYRERTKVENVIPTMEFTSYRQWGNQVNTLSLLISTDYNGIADEENIYKASWKDITTLATLSTGSDNTPSGLIDLLEFKDEKILYIAFKFEGWQSSSSAQRTWTIKNFQIKSLTPDGSSIAVIPSIGTAGWIAVDLKNNAKRWTITNTQIQIAGGGTNEPDNEDWIITRGINLSQVSPDRGTPIIDIIRSKKSHEFIYTKPGTYKVVFEAINGNVKGQLKTVKELEVIVKEPI